jgi:TolA-binding protein
VTSKDPQGKLGLQALYRSASTDALFLSNYSDAIRKFKIYAESDAANPDLAWESLKQVGEIFFTKTEQYDQAIQHYREILKRKTDAPESAEFNFRIAKSYFYLRRFDEAQLIYKQIIEHFPGSLWAEQALFEVGETYFTRGEQMATSTGRDRQKSSYQEASESYQKFLAAYPNSTLVPQAKFGIASCLEEMDQLDDAYRAYEALKSTYPSPNVIVIKMTRIRQRQAQRNR